MVLFTCSSSRYTFWAPRPKRKMVYPVVLELLLRRLPWIRECALWGALLACKVIFSLHLFVTAVFSQVWRFFLLCL